MVVRKAQVKMSKEEKCMGYIMNLRKYIGHEPLIGIGATTLVLNDKKEILLYNYHILYIYHHYSNSGG